MKKLILILLVPILTSCISLVSEDKKNMWALENDYINAGDCPELVVPERTALDHPDIPFLKLYDGDGIYIPITESYLMNIIVKLFGTVEKYQFLAEIYEREYLNADGRIMPDLTLDELKELYLDRINAIDKTVTPAAEVELTTDSGYPITGATILEDLSTDDMTIEGFVMIIEAFNYFQEYGE